MPDHATLVPLLAKAIGLEPDERFAAEVSGPFADFLRQGELVVSAVVELDDTLIPAPVFVANV